MSPTDNFIIDVPMPSLDMEFQVRWIGVLHRKATLITPASGPLLPLGGGVAVPRELLVDAGGVCLHHLGILGGGLILPVTRIRLGWSLGGAGAGGGRRRRVPHYASKQRQGREDRGD